MMERFGKDSLIALATVVDGVPNVRTVDRSYENGAFYVLTYALSNKMKQIKKNSVVATSGEWFTAHGIGRNLGWYCKKENELIGNKMRCVFAERKITVITILMMKTLIFSALSLLTAYCFPEELVMISILRNNAVNLNVVLSADFVV